MGLGPSTTTTVRYAVQGDRLVLIDSQSRPTQFARAEVLEYQ
jgi:hypothetical protein